MNIEDNSISVSWTNTSSSGFASTANVTYPWNFGHEEWRGVTYGYPEDDLSLLDPFQYRNITPDTPISRLATQTATERGSYSWPLWMFGVVAGSLTFGSIIVPLLAPPAYRSIARFSLRRRRTFRTIVSTLWMA
jgi:hypothetical protein